MPQFTVPLEGGGAMTVNASDPAAAVENVQQQGGTPQGGTGGVIAGGHMMGGPGNPPSAPGPTGPGTPQPNPQDQGGGVTAILQALKNGDQRAFDEAVRQFNANFGLNLDKFHEDIRQYNQNFGITQAGVTGTYQGSQTQQAQQQAFNQAQAIAGMTGYWNAPGAPGGAGGGNPALAQYPPGTVVRTSSNQFGVVGPNGTLDTNPNNPAIFQAAQSGQGIITIPDTAFVATPAGAPGGAGMAGTPTLAAQQQAYAQQMGMIQAAAALQANPFRQQQVIGQMGRLLSGQGMPGFQAPNTVPGVGTAGGNTQGGMGYLQQMLNDISGGGQAGPGQPGQVHAFTAMPGQQQAAVMPGGGQALIPGQPGQVNATVMPGGGLAQIPGQGPGGGGLTRQMIDDIRSPASNTQSMDQILEGIPTPNKLNSVEFMRAAPSTQNMVLQGMSEKYGLSPTDAYAQIHNTLPQFTAPTTFGGTVRR